METTAYLLEAFRIEGLSHVFLVPGGLIDPFLLPLTATDGITPIVAAHESGAAFMADGYARASGRFGACFAIGGPGITNMVTAVAAASTDQSPVLVISGQVPTDWEGRGGFQDSSPAALNDVALFQSLAKSSLIVENPHLVHHHFRASLMTMLASPQGPAHLSLPLDIQRADVHLLWDKLDASVYSTAVIDPGALERLWQTLLPDDRRQAPSRIVVLAGSGVEKSRATSELLTFAERFEIPVATTLRAKGVFPEDHRLSLGIFGFAGHRHAIETIVSGEVEVLLVLGSGLSQWDTLFWDRKMLPRSALIHVDLDPKVIGRTWPTEVPLVGDCGQVLRGLLNAEPHRLAAVAHTNEERRTWVERLRASGPRYYDPELVMLSSA